MNKFMAVIRRARSVTAQKNLIFALDADIKINNHAEESLLNRILHVQFVIWIISNFQDGTTEWKTRVCVHTHTHIHKHTKQKVNTPPTTSTTTHARTPQKIFTTKNGSEKTQPRMGRLSALDAKWKMREGEPASSGGGKKARFMTKTWVKRVIVIDAITLHAKIAKALQ